MADSVAREAHLVSWMNQQSALDAKPSGHRVAFCEQLVAVTKQARGRAGGRGPGLHRTVVAAFPDRFSPEPVEWLLTSQVPTSAAGQTLYHAVDYFERVLFKGRLGTPCRVAQRVPLRGIMSLHNTDGIRDVPQIGGMIRQVLAGGDILRASGLPNARVVVTSKNETVLFDGHHTVMAYIAAGCNYLDEVPHLVVHNGNGCVADREIPALFRTHSKELSPSDWRHYVINWEAPADRQLRVRIQGSVAELFDSLCPQIFALRDRPAKLGQT